MKEKEKKYRLLKENFVKYLTSEAETASEYNKGMLDIDIN